jgi:hypothetical protein
MARKFHLVPADQYQQMMQSGGGSDDASAGGDSLLDYNEKKLKELLKPVRTTQECKGRSALSFQRQKFDEQLYRFLKQRKETGEQPQRIKSPKEEPTSFEILPSQPPPLQPKTPVTSSTSQKALSVTQPLPPRAARSREQP